MPSYCSVRSVAAVSCIVAPALVAVANARAISVFGTDWPLRYMLVSVFKVIFIFPKVSMLELAAVSFPDMLPAAGIMRVSDFAAQILLTAS